MYSVSRVTKRRQPSDQKPRIPIRSIFMHLLLLRKIYHQIYTYKSSAPCMLTDISIQSDRIILLTTNGFASLRNEFAKLKFDNPK